jgi:hypothetical protein
MVKASLDGLSALVAEDIEVSAEARNWFCQCSLLVVWCIDQYHSAIVKENERQRGDQEKLLRTLAAGACISISLGCI